MKTYDVNALKNIADISEVYDGYVMPFFNTRARTLNPNGQIPKMEALRRQLILDFQIAALQTIESAEHLAQILAKPISGMRMDANSGLILMHIDGWLNRLQDTAPTTKDALQAFQKNPGSQISYSKIELESCNYFLTIHAGKNRTYICIEDTMDGKGQGGIGPSANLKFFYEDNKEKLDAVLDKFPKPHFWHQRFALNVDTQGGEFLYYIGKHDDSGIDGSLVFLKERPRAIDIASIVKYDDKEISGQILTLPELGKRYEGTGCLGFDYNVDRALKRDILAIIFDAARDELLDRDGHPFSDKAYETSKQLYLLPDSYKLK